MWRSLIVLGILLLSVVPAQAGAVAFASFNNCGASRVAIAPAGPTIVFASRGSRTGGASASAAIAGGGGKRGGAASAASASGSRRASVKTRRTLFGGTKTVARSK